MQSTIFIMEFMNNADVFMVILVRLVGFFMMLPIFSGTSFPITIRIMFIVPFAMVIYTSGVVTGMDYNDSVFGLGALLVNEFLTGLTMSFVVYIIFTVMYMAGQFIDQQIGFSMVSVLDPITQIQVPITGNLLNMLMLVMLIRSGGLNSFIAAIFQSFEVLPVGQANIFNNDFISGYILSLVLEYFEIGVSIALPIMGTIFIVDISMGLLVKAAPQMNVFVVGMPMKLLVGLFILYIVMPYYGGLYTNIYTAAMKALVNVVGGLTP